MRSRGHLVEGGVRAGADRLDDDVGVQEVGRDHVRNKGSVFLLEYDGHDIVPDVPLSLQLHHNKETFIMGWSGK